MEDSIIAKYFKEINQNFDYCVLRGYSKLPYEISNDIDLGLRHIHLDDFVKFSIKYFASKNFLLVHHQRKFKYVQLYFSNKITSEVIHIDIWTSLHFQGYEYMDINDLLDNKISYKGFFIASSEFECCLTITKDYLHTGELQLRKKEHLRSLAKERFGVPLKNRISEASIAQLRDALFSEKESKINIKFKFSALELFDIFFTKFSFFRDEIKLFFEKKGMFIVLIGPDGSGKTTTYNIIKNKIAKKYFSGTSYFHFNFGLIPSLSSLIGRQKKNNENNVTSLKMKDSSPSVKPSALKRFIYIAYYIFDFFLGNFKIYFLSYRNKLVVFDRYYFDYFIHQDYVNLPRFIMPIYKLLSPKPDILIYLKADANKIFERKPELSISQIKMQQQKIDFLITENPDIAGSICEVTTTDGEEIVHKQLNDIIFEYQMKRYK